MKKVAIVGANSAIAVNFIARHGSEFEITAIARSFDHQAVCAKTRYLSHDYQDFSDLSKVFEDCHNIFYCVGVTNADDAVIKEVNEKIFERFMKAVETLKVNIVFVSSAALLYNSGAYADSKRHCETLLKKSGHPFISLRPSVMHGPYDKNNLVKLENFARKLPVIPVVGPSFVVQPVYMPDIVDAVATAFREERFTNREYTVSGPEQVKLSRLFSLIKRKLNTRKPMVKIPLRPVQWAVRTLSLFLPKDKILAHQILNMKIHPPFDSSDFVSDYRFQQSSVESSIMEYGPCAG